eukprot:scaffold73242_cov40-Tisochrysis_lutea.AAC.1
MQIPPNCARLNHLVSELPGSVILCLPPPLSLASERADDLISDLPCLVPFSEWAVNQHRDSHALYVGFDSLSSFFSIAENEAIGRVKFSSLQVCIAGCTERNACPLNFIIQVPSPLQ